MKFENRRHRKDMDDSMTTTRTAPAELAAKVCIIYEIAGSHGGCC